jgi:hypothetical protein
MQSYGQNTAGLIRPSHLHPPPGLAPGQLPHQLAPPIKGASVRALSMLNLEEIREFLACEEVISKGWDTFVAVGSALARIRDKRLYRADFDTFEEYCRQKWLYGKAHAYRLIGAAEVIAHLSPIGDIPLPRNEAQVRPLLGLAPDEIQAVWRAALRKAGKKRITARLVERTAAEFRERRLGPASASEEPTCPHQIWSALRHADKLLQRAKRSLRRGDVKTAHHFLGELRDGLLSSV